MKSSITLAVGVWGLALQLAEAQWAPLVGAAAFPTTTTTTTCLESRTTCSAGLRRNSINGRLLVSLLDSQMGQQQVSLLGHTALVTLAVVPDHQGASVVEGPEVRVGFVLAPLREHVHLPMKLLRHRIKGEQAGS